MKSKSAILGLIGALILAGSLAARADDAGSVGTITQVNGTANVSRGTASIPAATGASVMLHDTITTDAGAYVVISFGDGSSMSVSPSSSATLSDSESSGGKTVVSHVDLKHGNVHVNVPDPNGKPIRELTVSTNAPDSNWPVPSK
jgi:hypothetical protein